MNAQNPLLVLADQRGWKVEQTVRGIAGVLVLAGTGLALLSPWWLLLTAFVGFNLLQSSLTGWCLMSNLLAMAGVGRRRA
jgi:hypothetical protein